MKGEIPVGFLVLKSGATQTPEEVGQYIIFLDGC